MYKWTLKHREENGANRLNPREVKQGVYMDTNSGQLIQLDTYATSGMMPVTPAQQYQGHSPTSEVFRKVVFFNTAKELVSGIDSWVSTFTVPSGCYYAVVSFRSISHNNTQPEEVGATLGLGSAFEPYFVSKQVQPIYKSMERGYDLESNYQFYREKLKGNLKLVRDDYDYVAALSFDTKIYIDIEDLNGVLPVYKGQFYKTDCKWDGDDRILEVKTEPADDYVEIMAGLEKTFNLIKIAPELEAITVRRRPLIQVYIPGDTVVTNLLGGTYWEQEIQDEPVFDHNTLVQTYKFANPKNIRIVPAAFGAGLSTDITGEYDDNRLNANGLYRLIEEANTVYPSFTRYRYKIQRVSDDVILYETGFTNWRESGVNLLPFNGVNGETGQFYFTEYRIYVRYYTDLLNVRGTDTYAVPNEDIVANNRNYRRVIGYNIDSFYIYDQFTDTPTQYGRVPDDAPNGGKYYKQFLVSVTTGLSQPQPVSSSNWRAVSLWFFNTLDIRYTEFIDGQDFKLRDAYTLHGTIKALLREVGSNVTHDNSTQYSEFLYSANNPLGGFTFLDFNGGTIATDYEGNITHFLTPKSNIIAGEYDQPAQKAEITLGQVLNMLRDVYRVFWHIENGKLRFEHISWYQNGGTYGAPIVGADLTLLKQPRNGKSWGFSQNKWAFDKENMPERFEFGWMDDVSPPFDGSPIQIRSNYVQLGRIEDLAVNGITTDIDFVMGNAQEISKDGFCLISAVVRGGIYRVPFIEMELGYNEQVIMQNGLLSWTYLHPKFHVYDLPSDKANINGDDVTLFQNNTRQKKQEVTYPANQGINPYQLVRTQLGDGIIDKLMVSMESYIVKATIKHDTD
ncbi:hypothetical protein B620_gp23 [Croceibacter phage P2559S]|uniref:hypothetical protein n=1 Tax=Croceibacter phage P2559S TaxID=1176422 RepID=UPI0002688EB2|nr:hypothetical protein B620_gp23 [Croceibacter phage P2559S]AFM54801.1 hypothetical protein P2559S_23 [Croceibacter phage P2559S]